MGVCSASVGEGRRRERKEGRKEGRKKGDKESWMRSEPAPSSWCGGGAVAAKVAVCSASLVREGRERERKEARR